MTGTAGTARHLARGRQRKAPLLWRWPFLTAAGIGVWLLAAPHVLGYDGPARASHLVVGPIAASGAVISMWPATRALRWVNVGLGAWLVASLVVLSHPPDAAATSLVGGSALFLVSLVHGPVHERLGSGWKMLFRRVPREPPGSPVEAPESPE